MTQRNEASGASRELRRIDPAEAAPPPHVLGLPAGAGAIGAAGPARSTLRQLEQKVTYVELRIKRAAKANSRVACFLLCMALATFACFVAALAIGAADGKKCHCEAGGTGYRQDNGDAWCAEDEVEVCSLEVAKIMMWGTIAAAFFATTVLATLSNPPRFWMLRELQKFRVAVERAVSAESLLSRGPRADLDEFGKRGHKAIDACDRRVRVDKWTFAAVRADWRAFLAQGWVTYAEACRIRSV
eukprot:CAMPEP_0113822142 /NCGR_PEP_ID=MMETSP0328-20130328/2092_1 /TAXON_ID=39455 /ORGANISM="Alexandrium minutum" /LENGTH=242 /DNA_ID=CAMNT_0000790077 /DNA_START=247 /DNA_END=972 /DNA_ORIENTATION=- /assembly_acc=CAM_ASM_000350